MNPTPIRQRIKTFLTPRVEDFMVAESVDITLRKIPEVGSPHPDDKKFPNFLFAHAVASDDQGLVDTFLYLKDRKDQETYSWEWADADIGGRKFKAVQLTYVTLRSEFTSASPAMGAALPSSVPITGLSGSYVLAERAQVRSEDWELDNLFVIDVHTYVQRVTISEVRYDEATGRGDVDTTTLYYKGETVSGTAVETLFASPTNTYWGLQTDGTFRSGEQLSDNWYAVKEASVVPPSAANTSSNHAKKRIVERVTPTGTDLIIMETGTMPSSIPAYGSAHYDSSNYSGYVLGHIEPADKSGMLYDFFYVKARASEDAYNWEFTQADIGGTKFDAVKRTYVTLRSSFNPATPLPGASMPNTPASLFSGTYVLAGREQVRTNERKIDNLFVIDVRTYVKKTTQTQIDYDEKYGSALATVQTLYYSTEVVTGSLTAAALFAAPTNAFWGLQTDGTMNEGRQLSAHWYVISNRRIVPADLVSPGRTYYSTIDYSWPAVLGSIEFDSWERKDGGAEDYVRPKLSKEAYRGPCRATIQEIFYVSPPSAVELSHDTLQPLPINISNPFFSISIGPTLHAGDTLTITTGTDHPVYEYTAGSYTIDATTPDDWPDTLVISDEVQPFRGGYLRQTITIDKPY